MNSISSAEEDKGYILRQLFDKESFTYTYLLGDISSSEAVLIDPVFDLVPRDLELVDQLDLSLKYVMNTHLHADHVTGTGLIKELLGGKVKSVISKLSEADADVKIKDGDKVHFGNVELEVRSTPGHTKGCMTYIFHEGGIVFTGDALLIRGCGRTDMQGGCPITLYNSVHDRIFTLPDDYIVYPGHDYKGRTMSTIREEKLFNPRLTQPLLDFIEIMRDFGTRHKPPEILSIAVKCNRVCGLYDLPPEMKDKRDALVKRKGP